MKRILTAMLFVFVLFTGAVLSACGENNNNMTISIDNTNVEIFLGETENDTVVVRATVKNATDDRVTFDYDQNSLVITPKYVGNGVTEASIKALRDCSVDVNVIGVKKTTSFHVSAIIPLSSISAKSQTHYMTYSFGEGGSFVLSNSLLEFAPKETIQTKVNFRLVNEIEGVSISSSNKLTIAKELATVPTTIKVEAVSAVSGKDNIKAVLDITVVPGIDSDSISILDLSGAQANDSYNVSRNSQTDSVLYLVVRIPDAEPLYEIIPRVLFKYNDKGIVWNDTVVQSNDQLSCKDYIFSFAFDKFSGTTVGTDFLYFEYYYKNYPEIKVKSNEIAITTFDEITSIGLTVNGENAGNQTEFNAFTVYDKNIYGLGIKFTALPTTSIQSQFKMSIDALDLLDNIIVKDAANNPITFVNGEYEFASDSLFYFMAKDGYSANSVQITITSTEKPSVSKVVTIKLNKGVTQVSFVRNSALVNNPTYYMENDPTLPTGNIIVNFLVLPADVDLSALMTINISGDVFELGGGITKTGTLNEGSLYSIPIKAKLNAIGEGRITLKFQTGYEIYCTVNTFTRFSDVKVQIEASFDQSSAIGKIDYNGSDIAAISVKNGHSIPLVYSSNAKIDSISYEFLDYVLTASDDVYDERGGYARFNYVELETSTFASISNVISSNYLRSLRYISPLAVGKTWVKITFTGKVLDSNGLYVDSSVVKYVLVEIYNPITSINVSVKNIELYPYDEVGESNKALSQAIFTVTLNGNGVSPTYNRLFWDGINNITAEDPYIFGNFSYNFYKIELVSLALGQYKISALTRGEVGFNGFQSPTSISINASNFNHVWNAQINLYMKSPQLVERIDVLNVPQSGIYLNANSSDVSYRNFKILTSVFPSNALNSELVYKFIPDFGVLENIITISDNGLVTVNGSIGGTGHIKVIPKDCVMLDEHGNEIYRAGTENVMQDIKIVIADGTKRETSIQITSLSEITNNYLHYTLIGDITVLAHESLFDSTAFFGGLYGKTTYSDFIATITMQGQSLFNILGSTAVIEDLNICGAVTGNGFICSENNGNIKNVNVNVYKQESIYFVSTVISTGTAGGLVGINAGTISNSTFSGSVEAVIAGGISGSNLGLVVDSKVQLFDVSAVLGMSITGSDFAGGITGTLDENGRIEKSYIYNYSDNNVLSLANNGAIAGEITSLSATIYKTMAMVGANANFYANAINGYDALNKIKDSYILTRNGSTMSFNAHMTTSSGISKQFSATDDSYVFEGVVYGAALTWIKNSALNFGYPSLNDVKYEAAVTGSELAALTIKNTALSWQEENSCAIMFVYKTDNYVLTSREQSYLNLLNTISLKTLFNISSSSGLLITSSDDNIIGVGVDSLIVRNAGSAVIKIASRLDYKQQPKEVTVLVVYTSNAFALEYGEYKLSNESQLGIKNGKSDVVTSVINKSVSLVDRVIPIKQNNYDVQFINKDNGTSLAGTVVMGSKIGSHIISTTFTGDELIANVYLTLQDSLLTSVEPSLKQTFLNILKTNTLKTLTIKKTNGADKIEIIGIKTATITPSEVLSFTAHVYSDLYVATNTDLEGNIILTDTNEWIVASGEYINMFDIGVNLISDRSNLPIVGNKYKIEFKITVEVNDLYKGLTFKPDGYEITFMAHSDNNINTSIKVFVLEQEITKIDLNHFNGIYDSSVDGSTYSSEPNNVLSPGRFGLLQLNLYPNYSAYSYITVTAEPINGLSLNLKNMKKRADNINAFDIAPSRTYEYITNGLKIYKVETNNSFGTYYIKTTVPANVKIDSVYRIAIRVYSSSNELMTEEIFNLIVVPQESAGITVNGERVITAVKGSQIQADIIVEKTQDISSISITDFAGDSINTVSISDYVLVNENYGNKYQHYSLKLNIGETSDSFKVIVRTSRYLNGNLEIVSSELVVYTMQFSLDFENTHLANETASDTLNANKLFYTNLDFNIAGSYFGESNTAAFNQFLRDNYYYYESSFIVNYLYPSISAYRPMSLIKNLNYVTGNSTTPVYNSVSQTINSNSIIEISEYLNSDGLYRLRVIGKQIGTQAMSLTIPVLMPDNSVVVYTYNFVINITSYTDEDSPETISTEEAFLNMVNNDVAQDYILMQDIKLYNYVPIENTSKILSLDGNGKTITIVNFASNPEDTGTSLSLSLFKRIEKTTTIKNLRLNIYHLGEIIVDSRYSNIEIAPIAITNDGIITNTSVVSYQHILNTIIPSQPGLNVNISNINNVSAKISGFAVYNNGSITNSRVGGEELEIISVNSEGVVSKQLKSLGVFNIIGKGEISGFVYDNKGLISSSYVSNVRIVNKTDVDYTTITTGFANMNSGTIVMSYAKGVKASSSNIHATKFGIETSGIASGFVYLNSNFIENCYSNITLTNSKNNPGRNSAGFVFINEIGSIIEKSYSFSKIIGSTTTQMNFAGVDEWGDYQNRGLINNSYYFDDSLDTDIEVGAEEAYGKTAKLIAHVNYSDYFYGFSFKGVDTVEQGIWKMTETGPELINTNMVSNSIRYSAPGDKDVLVYASGYEYGSANNPIIIRDAYEFNEVFGNSKRSSVQKYYDKSAGMIFGNYRLVNDINLLELGNEKLEYRLSSSSMTLTGAYSSSGNLSAIGKFNGNGLTVSGLALTDTGAITDNKNFGIFNQITNGAVVENLNIIMGVTNPDNIVSGIEAKNIKYVGTLAGTVSSSTIVNVNIESSIKDSSEVTVRGKNVVGGVAGRVVGASYLFNLSVKDISVSASQYPSPIIIGGNVSQSHTSYNAYVRVEGGVSNNNNVSYAGGIAGVIDYYNQNTIGNNDYIDIAVSNKPNAAILKNTGVMKVIGGTVGGLFGLVGNQTLVQDGLLELAEVIDKSAQAIISYNGYAGGIVGYNQGFLRQVRSEHEQTLQQKIEDNIQNYYTGTGDYYFGNDELFYSMTYRPNSIGGLVGMMKSGKIEKSYSKINVKNNNATNAGGVIGLIAERNVGVEVETQLVEVYAFGDVYAGSDLSVYNNGGNSDKYNIGGIIGRCEAGALKLEKVNAVNFWTVKERSYYAIIGYYLPGLISMSNAMEKSLVSATEKVVQNQIEDNNYNNQTNINENIVDNINAPVYADFLNITTDGDKMDVIFSRQEWESSSWRRDNNELLPHMIFGYSKSVYYIRTQEDINLMRLHNEKGVTFIIIGDDNNDGRISITKTIAPIVNFQGNLRGKDSTKEYGFIFEYTPTQALFKLANGARFSDFFVSVSNNIGSISMTLSNSALWIQEAKGCTFSNLDFTGITINVTSENVNAAILVAKSSSCLFSSVSFNNCGLNITATSSVNAGILTGICEDVNESTSISNINFKLDARGDSDPNVGKIQVVSRGSANVGLIVGYAGFINNGSKGSTVTVISDNSPIKSKMYEIVFESGNNQPTQEYEVNIGYLIGATTGIKQLASISDEKMNYVTGKITCTLSGGTYANVGGLVGKTTLNETNITSIISNVQINIFGENPSAKTSNIGAIVGYASNCTINDTAVGVNRSDLTDNELSDDYLKISKVALGATRINPDKSESIDKPYNGKIYVGSIFGFATDSNIEKVISYIDIVSTTTQEEGIDNVIAGLVGALTSSNIESSAYFGSVTINNVGGEDRNYNHTTGGLVGLTTGTNSIKSCKFGGVIAFNICNNTSKGNYVVGGAVAEVDAQTIVESNFTFGEIIANNGNIGLQGVNNITYGGLIGSNSSSNIIKNISLTTLINKIDEKIVVGNNAYKAKSLVGNTNDSNETITYPIEDNANKYSHVYNLTTDLDAVGQNQPVIAYFDTTKYNSGHKLNPIMLKETNIKNIDFKNTERKYLYLEEDVTLNQGSEIILLNKYLISDGNVITNTETSGHMSVIKYVDDNSVVSGIVVNTNSAGLKNYAKIDSDVLDSSYAGYVGGFVSENRGIVYSCNVSGPENSYKASYLSGTDFIGGFAGRNVGLIKDCFSYVDIEITSNPKNQSIVAGFVAKNNGLIVNCYSSGQIDDNVGASKVTTLNGKKLVEIYAFGDGSVCYSYTITKVLADSAYTFSNVNSEVKDCFYDLYALETFALETKAAQTLTDYVSVAAGKTAPGCQETEGIWALDEGNKLSYITDTNNTMIINNNITVWGFDSADNFGYPSFLQNGYNNVKYMHRKTVDIDVQGNITNYQIPNIGKFEQIRLASNKSYKLIYDSDLEIFMEKYRSYRWKAFNFSGKIIGEDCSITGMKQDESLFNEISGEISNIKIIEPFQYKVKAGFGGVFANKLTDTGKLNNVQVAPRETIIEGAIIENGVFGILVGESSGSIKGCSVTSVSQKTATKTIDDYDIVFGGLVGELAGGTLEESYLNLKLTLITDNKSLNTFTFGGIVGKQTGGTITLCYLASNSNLQIAQSDVFVPASGVDSNTKVYAGGIVGKSEGGLIEQCYTLDETIILGGNIYNTKEAYVGGISGYGGNITDCYNKAEVTARAIISAINPIKKNTLVDESPEGTIDHMLYAEFEQKAYAGGIANEFGSVDTCMNYGTIIGGKKARNIFAFFDANDTQNVNLHSIMKIYHKFSIALLALGPIVVGTPHPFDDIIYLASCSVLLSSVLKLLTDLTLAVDGEYYNGNDNVYYENKVDYFRGVQNDFYEGRTLVSEGWQSYITGVYEFWAASAIIDDMNEILHKHINFNTKKLDVISKFESSNTWADLTAHKTQGQIDAVYGNNLILYDVYFNGIGFSSTGSINDAYSGSEEIGSVVLGGTERVKVYDNEGSYADNKLVYKPVSDVIIGKLNLVENIIKEIPGEGEISSSNWTYANEEWTLANSAENKKTALNDLTIDLNKKEVVVETEEDLKAVVALVNNWDSEGNNTYIEDETNNNYPHKDQLKQMFSEGGYTIKVNRTIDLATLWVPMGTEANPFKGSLVFASNVKLQQCKITKEYWATGFIGYAENSSFSKVNLQIDINTFSVSNPIVIGSFIGVVKEDATVNINNCKINSTIVDFKEIINPTTESINTIISSQPANIGGVIGEFKGKSLSIVDSAVNAEIESRALRDSANPQVGNSNFYAGGVIGVFDNGQELQIENITVNSNINLNKSSINVGAGLIGYMNAVNLTSDAEINWVTIGSFGANNYIQVDSTMDSYAAGVFGILAHGNKDVQLGNISINSTNISANVSAANKTTYAAGIVAKIENSNGLLILNNCNIGASSSDNGVIKYLHRLYIKAGMGGAFEPRKSYADDLVAIDGGWNNNNIITTDVKFNGKCLANAKHSSYDSYPSVSNSYKEKTILKEDVLDHEGEPTGSYYKLDMIEFEEIIDSSNTDAYVNGERQNLYNSKKTYIFISSYVYKKASGQGMLRPIEAGLGGISLGEDGEEAKAEAENNIVQDINGNSLDYAFVVTEKIYMLNIYGIYGQYQDFDLDYKYDFDSVKENKYYIMEDSVRNLSFNNRDENFLPNSARFASYSIQNNGQKTLIKEVLLKSQATIVTNTDSSFAYISKDLKEYVYNGNNKSDMSQGNMLHLNDSGSRIKIRETRSQKPSVAWLDIDLNTLANRATPIESTLFNSSLDNIEYSNKLETTTFIDIKNSDVVVNVAKYSSMEPTYAVNVRSEFSNVTTDNFGNSKQKFIISYIQLNGNGNDTHYTDYIFEISWSGAGPKTVKYLGYIEYDLNNNVSGLVARNKFNFPVTELGSGAPLTFNEINNLLPINKVQTLTLQNGLYSITSLLDDIVYTEKQTENHFIFDITNTEIIKIKQEQTKVKTITLKPQKINISSGQVICDVEQSLTTETPDTTGFDNNPTIERDTSNDQKDWYKITYNGNEYIVDVYKENDVVTGYIVTNSSQEEIKYDANGNEVVENALSLGIVNGKSITIKVFVSLGETVLYADGTQILSLRTADISSQPNSVVIENGYIKITMLNENIYYYNEEGNVVKQTKSIKINSDDAFTVTEDFLNNETTIEYNQNSKTLSGTEWNIRVDNEKSIFSIPGFLDTANYSNLIVAISGSTRKVFDFNLSELTREIEQNGFVFLEFTNTDGTFSHTMFNAEGTKIYSEASDSWKFIQNNAVAFAPFSIGEIEISGDYFKVTDTTGAATYYNFKGRELTVNSYSDISMPNADEINYISVDDGANVVYFIEQTKSSGAVVNYQIELDSGYKLQSQFPYYNSGLLLTFTKSGNPNKYYSLTQRVFVDSGNVNINNTTLSWSNINIEYAEGQTQSVSFEIDFYLNKIGDKYEIVAVWSYENYSNWPPAMKSMCSEYNVQFYQFDAQYTSITKTTKTVDPGDGSDYTINIFKITVAGGIYDYDAFSGVAIE